MELPPEIHLLSEDEVAKATKEAQEKERKRLKEMELKDQISKIASNANTIRKWNEEWNEKWLKDATLEKINENCEALRLKELEFLKNYWIVFPNVPEDRRKQNEENRTKVEMMAEALMMKLQREIIKKRTQQKEEEDEKERSFTAHAVSKAIEEANQKQAAVKEEQTKKLHEVERKLDELQVSKQVEVNKIKKQLHEETKKLSEALVKLELLQRDTSECKNLQEEKTQLIVELNVEKQTSNKNCEEHKKKLQKEEC